MVKSIFAPNLVEVHDPNTDIFNTDTKYSHWWKPRLLIFSISLLITKQNMFGTSLHECKSGEGHICSTFPHRVNMKCFPTLLHICNARKYYVNIIFGSIKPWWQICESNKCAIFLCKIFPLAKTMFAHIFYNFAHNQRNVFGTYLHECKPGNGHIRFTFAHRVNMTCSPNFPSYLQCEKI